MLDGRRQELQDAGIAADEVVFGRGLEFLVNWPARQLFPPKPLLCSIETSNRALVLDG